MCNITISLKAARVNAGFTQDEAATALDIAKATLNAWENNRGTVSEIALTALADLYKVPKEAFSLQPNFAKCKAK